MVPTMIAMVLDHPDFRPERLASLRDLVYGASPMPPALLDRLMRAAARRPAVAGLRDDRVLVGAHLPHRRGPSRQGGPRLRSAGRPVFGVNLSIQDTRGRAPVGAG